MRTSGVITELTKRRREAVEKYYEHVHRSNDESLSQDERRMNSRIAEIYYGKVDAYNEAMEIIRKAR